MILKMNISKPVPLIHNSSQLSFSKTPLFGGYWGEEVTFGNIFIWFIFCLTLLLPTACLVPGLSTAVNESCGSQLSKHSTLKDSPECVLLCQNPPHPPVRAGSGISLVTSLKDLGKKALHTG